MENLDVELPDTKSKTPIVVGVSLGVLACVVIVLVCLTGVTLLALGVSGVLSPYRYFGHGVSYEMTSCLNYTAIVATNVSFVSLFVHCQSDATMSLCTECTASSMFFAVTQADECWEFDGYSVDMYSNEFGNVTVDDSYCDLACLTDPDVEGDFNCGSADGMYFSLLDETVRIVRSLAPARETQLTAQLQEKIVSDEKNAYRYRPASTCGDDSDVVVSCNVLLCVTGSIGSRKIHSLVSRISTHQTTLNLKSGKKIVNYIPRVVLTDSAIQFTRNSSLSVPLFTDGDWRSSFRKLGDPVLHIDLRNWADVGVVAPLSANSLAKLSNGMCDNLVSCIFRAWEWGRRPVIVAPGMNNEMWNARVTREHIERLKELSQGLDCGCGVRVVGPIVGRHAYGGGRGFGIGAMAIDQMILDGIEMEFVRNSLMKISDTPWRIVLISSIHLGVLLVIFLFWWFRLDREVSLVAVRNGLIWSFLVAAYAMSLQCRLFRFSWAWFLGVGWPLGGLVQWKFGIRFVSHSPCFDFLMVLLISIALGECIVFPLAHRGSNLLLSRLGQWFLI